MEIAGTTDKQSSTPSATGVTQTSEAAAHQVTVHSQDDKVSGHQVNLLTTSSSAATSSSTVKQASQSSVATGNGIGHQEGQGQGLPQTGNSQSILAMIMGLITGSLSLLGLRKRHF
jgi:LPXTG-motif cell wall-anchored protein